MRNSKLQQGFTLVELLITIAVMAIFAAIALPSMGAMTASAKLNEAALGYSHIIKVARQESLRQGVNTYICGADIRLDGKINGCRGNTYDVSNKYALGALAFADKDKDGVYDANEALQTFYTKPNIRVQVSYLATGDNASNLRKFPNTGGVFGFLGNGSLIGEPVAIRFKFTDMSEPEDTAKCSIAYMDFGGRANVCTRQDRARDGYIGRLCDCSLIEPKSI